MSAGAPSRNCRAERVGEHEQGRDPAAPAGHDGALVRAAGDLPDQRAQHPAAVERQPRHQVQDADDEVRPGQSLGGQVEQRAVGGQDRQRDRGDADRERGQRADHRDAELAAGGVRLAVDLGDAAEEVQRDGPDRQAVVLGHQRVRGLVQQHREVEQHREREAGDVLPGAETGLDLLDGRGQHHRDDRRDEQPRGPHQDVHAADLADPEGAGRALGRVGTRSGRFRRAPRCAGRPPLHAIAARPPRPSVRSPTVVSRPAAGSGRRCR